jgi:hypothetical protein
MNFMAMSTYGAAYRSAAEIMVKVRSKNKKALSATGLVADA